MPNEDNKTLDYNHKEKSLKVPFIIDVDIESLPSKMPFCQNNPEKSYTEKSKAYTFRLRMVTTLLIWYIKKTNVIFTEGGTVWKGFVKR